MESMDNKPLRVMWLLNHSTARKFEIAALNAVGIQEIFLPKSYPNDPRFRSASIDYSHDQYLTIPEKDLAILNSVDWYMGGTKEAVEIANKYFDVAFYIVHNAKILENFIVNFKGITIWRAYGLDKSESYSKIINGLKPNDGIQKIKKRGSRFYFGEAYSHLGDIEEDYIKAHRLYLPLGLPNIELRNTWQGNGEEILFVCPDVGFSPYYQKIYKEFKQNFNDIPHIISGAQPIKVDDKSVIGFVDSETHHKNMKQCAAMFYHSQEPNHIHYHPFEAIRVGMPLIFMANGLLDRMGGRQLPGRCQSIAEARKKIERIVAKDQELINAICSSQKVLLEPMSFDHCIPHWQLAFEQIKKNIAKVKQTSRELFLIPKKRIAIILPVKFRGGSLRGAKLLAEAIMQGFSNAGEAIEIVLCHLNDPAYTEREFDDLNSKIKIRTFEWKKLSREAARRAMNYVGQDNWKPMADCYVVPDDGINYLQDCDVWVIISDRLEFPLLPVKPYILMVYDYIQRYIPILSDGLNNAFLQVARQASEVWVTTNFTQQDALQYAGLELQKVKKMPMLAPKFDINIDVNQKSNYFIWTTNLAPHKNHRNTIEALEIYYSQLGGNLKCIITGVQSDKILKKVKKDKNIKKALEVIAKHIIWKGELKDDSYRKQLNAAAFLLHSAFIDNGTFSVIEAASLGVPSLSSDYPAMREIDSQFKLSLSWMDANSPYNMALQLKKMEENYDQLRKNLPTEEEFKKQSVDNLSVDYWAALRNYI